MNEYWTEIEPCYPKILHHVNVDIAATILHIIVGLNKVNECREFVKIRPDAVPAEESSAFRLACELGMSFL